jgi:hypothetical protein
VHYSQPRAPPQALGCQRGGWALAAPDLGSHDLGERPRVRVLAVQCRLSRHYQAVRSGMAGPQVEGVGQEWGAQQGQAREQPYSQGLGWLPGR